jgi:hypothetical protein
MKTSTQPAAAGGAGSGAGGAGAGAHHPHSNPHTHAQSLPRPWSTREIANRFAKDEAVAILFGAETNERIAARAAIEDLQVQCELNEQSNKDKYQLLPRTKKEALHEAPELLALVDIVEGVIRKLHFSCLYLVDKCLVKTVKPVVHTYCHEYSNYLDQNCAELRKSSLGFALSSSNERPESSFTVSTPAVTPVSSGEFGNATISSSPESES